MPATPSMSTEMKTFTQSSLAHTALLDLDRPRTRSVRQPRSPNRVVLLRAPGGADTIVDSHHGDTATGGRGSEGTFLGRRRAGGRARRGADLRRSRVRPAGEVGAQRARAGARGTRPRPARSRGRPRR